jgi:hypothetical protein
VKISSCDEESVSSDEEENINHSSSMQRVIWANSGSEEPRLPFTGKPGINVDLEEPRNPLEYFELFCTQEIAEVITREVNSYAKNLENFLNPKIRSRFHHWKETKSLECFLLKGLYLDAIISYFFGGKFWKY